MIRKEDELYHFRADRGYVLYLNTKDGILPSFVATLWKKIEEEDKSKLDKSLRMTLLLAMEKTLSDPAMKAVAQQAEWLTTVEPGLDPPKLGSVRPSILEDLRRLTVLVD